MEHARFDRLVKALATAAPRRRLLQGLGGGLLAGGLAATVDERVDAKRRHRPGRAQHGHAVQRKKKKCKHGTTRCGKTCVKTATDPANCGGCGQACASGQDCQNGACACAGSQCAGCCDGATCQTGDTATHCGVGGTACAACVGGRVCRNGTCACPDGQDVCADVCVDRQTDPNHCGRCDLVCDPTNTTAVACNAGVCQFTCSAGFTDCNQDPSDGCETHTGADVNNCGACNHVCNLPNATASCAGGNCQVATCRQGFADCNTNPMDGCEVSTQTDPHHCGTCGHQCALPNAAAGCVGGACAIASCNQGFTDCDGNPLTGCEIRTGADVNNCGACGHQCALPNATPSCTGGVCTIGACNQGFQDCNSDPSDGCEVHVASDPLNCGGCGHQCAFANATAGCAGGVCVIASCNLGFADCNSNPNDGCETHTAADVNNCGACGHVCPQGTTCHNGVCG